MKKLLIIPALLLSVNAQAFDISKYKDKVATELEKHDIKLEDIEGLNKDEMLKVVSQVKTMLNDKDFSQLTPEQLNMLKQAYEHLKSRKVHDPEMKKIVNKTIAIIDKTGVLN